MKILLDESVPQKLRLLIKGNYTVVTAWFQGWSGLKNGALLDAAEKTGFGLFITADQALSYQQNLTGRTIALVVLSTNNWSFIKAHVAEIMRVSIHLSALRPTLQSSIVFAERIGMRALQRSLQSRTHLSRSANNIHRAARRIATCLCQNRTGALMTNPPTRNTIKTRRFLQDGFVFSKDQVEAFAECLMRLHTCVPRCDLYCGVL